MRSIPTLRRLDDGERYYGLTWRGWLAAGGAVAVLYGAVRLSPFGFKPTVTVVVLTCSLAGSVLFGLQGQTIGPGRYVLALARYRRRAKQLIPPSKPDKHGLVLDTTPVPAPDSAPAFIGVTQ